MYEAKEADFLDAPIINVLSSSSRLVAARLFC